MVGVRGAPPRPAAGEGAIAEDGRAGCDLDVEFFGVCLLGGDVRAGVFGKG